ncbi:MAG TPA: hypothetical protein VMV23_09330 [Candidatus Nanopelagicaceae bacterium]|nr:hypothetical protein [Candidatus Nanopelagicaceae bacterium]
MAKSIAQGQAKWERKTANAGDKWKQSVAGAGGRYSQGLSESVGTQVGPQTTSAWEQGVGAVSAGDFNASISGKGSKWAENLRRGVSR